MRRIPGCTRIQKLHEQAVEETERAGKAVKEGKMAETAAENMAEGALA